MLFGSCKNVKLIQNFFSRHTMLFDYGIPENGNNLSSEDVDMDLVPKLVEKVVLPVLHHDIAHCWDILSTRSTKKAVSAVQEVLNYVPAASDVLQDLLSAVRVQLTEAVAKIEVDLILFIMTATKCI